MVGFRVRVRARASSVVSSGRAEAEGEGATVTVPGEHLEACAEGASLLALLGAEDKVGRVTVDDSGVRSGAEVHLHTGTWSAGTSDLRDVKAYSLYLATRVGQLYC